MGIGIYIHFPYCVSKCGYCDFSSFGKEKWPENFDGYISELLTEAKLYESGKGIEELKDLANYKTIEFKGFKAGMIDTVYFGGGTPSLIPEELVVKLLDFFKPYLKNDAEISMECNPGTVDYQKLLSLRKSGINRLSVGLQAAQDKILKKLGRIHSFSDFENTIEWAKKAGFENISADIMFGLPDQSLRDWKDTIEAVIKSEVSHISAYGLKIEEDTAFDRLVIEGVLVLPEVELERLMYHKACEIFESHGYNQYEISNFAKKGLESKHNLNYWKSGDYIGIGLNSHSKLGDVRFWNYSDMLDYEDKINQNILAVEGFEILDLEEKVFERLILSLRLNEGLSIEKFKNEFGMAQYLIIEPMVDKNIKKGLLEVIDGILKFTKEGRDLSNQVYIDFIRD